MKKSLAIDSSPLIILSKLKYLDNVFEFFDEVEIPEGVLKEVEKKEDDVKIEVKKLIDLEQLKREEIDVAFPFLGRGESSVIKLALDKNKVACLDDKKARGTAQDLGITVIGTLAILRRIHEIGDLKDENEVLYIKLRNLGFYLKPDLFRKFFT